MKKINKTILFDNVYIKSTSSIVGPKEHLGPLGEYFDDYYENLDCKEDSWEKAEIKLQEKALQKALTKGNLKENDLELIISGDLNNQIVASTYMLKNKNINHLGVYSACATFNEALGIGALLIDTKEYKNIGIISSSHYATSERQFRFPTEYGGQKPPSITSTVTGSGCIVLTSNKRDIKISSVTFGSIIDSTLLDPQDLGTTMASSAVDTLLTHLKDLNTSVQEYDMIVTGDLSYYGSKVFKELLIKSDIFINNHYDCGSLIYDRNHQNVFSGGSGSGCVSVVVSSYLYYLLNNKHMNKILVIATGALMNPILCSQKETIPCISHAVVFERVNI